MILYIEHPKDSTKKLLELISDVSKVAGYNINIQKLVVFLYTKDKTYEKEIKISHSQQHQNNKMLRNKFNQGSERSVQQKL